ncbi:MAG: archease [Methanocellales archaeon]
MMEKKFEYLEHTADVKFKAYGNCLEEAFANAAFAMFNAMIDLNEISFNREIAINLEAESLEDLLYDWLSELLYQFDANYIIFGGFEVDKIIERDGKFLIEGRAFGEQIDLKKHKFHLQVKAVTFHDMQIKKVNDCYTIQVLLDT